MSGPLIATSVTAGFLLIGTVVAALFARNAQVRAAQSAADGTARAGQIAADVQRAAQVAAASDALYERMRLELVRVSSDADKLRTDLQEAYTRIGALEQQRESDRRRITTLEDENASLRAQIAIMRQSPRQLP